MQTYKGIHNSFQYDSNDYLQDPLDIPEISGETFYINGSIFSVSPFDSLIKLAGGDDPIIRKNHGCVQPYRSLVGVYLPYTDVIEEHNTCISISKGTKDRLHIYTMSVDELIKEYGKVE